MAKSSTHQLTVQLDLQAKQRLDALADQRGQTANSLASEAIAYFLERTGNLTEAEREAVKRWEHYKTTGLHVTMEEADAWLAELEKGNDIEPPSCHL